MPLDPGVARRTFRTLEPIHAMIYFTPCGPEAYGEIGVHDDRMGYFASRSAALGAVGPDVVAATFFNFDPVVIRQVIPAAWDVARPGSWLDARLAAVDRSLRLAWGDDGVHAAEVAEAATLARTAAERATRRPHGRPLFAAHAELPWPEDAHLVLWHAQTLLREYRGDGHVALLTAAGLGPVEALVVHAATGEVSASILRRSRGWSEAEWEGGVEDVRARGWLAPGDDLALSPAGAEHRRLIEDRTDELAAWIYEAIGEEDCARLRRLARPLSIAVVEAGLLSPRFLARDDPTQDH